MAATISSTFLSASLLLLCLLSASRKGCVAFEQQELAAETHHHTLLVSSLLPSSVCNSSKAADKKSSSLTVIHKHGPCSQLTSDAPTHAEVLLHDQARVNSIHSRLAKTLNNVKETAASSIPAKDGSILGSGNYIVTVTSMPGIRRKQC
ncbi:hypothetical protein SLEP1_g1818 [Rubroshorea leprosula]|uniref:Uncharacterized protein n=1 Tax=Rubroshorea leprosula TaxID=152421 RepID=A0AAV5HM77_9ROSI|nr:hypothetical protein SLEP1_g1818 [Rubroshorea leprosula]